MSPAVKFRNGSDCADAQAGLVDHCSHVLATKSKCVMRGSRKFCQRGSNSATLTFFFFVFLLVMRGGLIQIPHKVGHHRSASETPFKWRFAGGPMMARH